MTMTRENPREAPDAMQKMTRLYKGLGKAPAYAVSFLVFGANRAHAFGPDPFHGGIGMSNSVPPSFGSDRM